MTEKKVKRLWHHYLKNHYFPHNLLLQLQQEYYVFKQYVFSQKTHFKEMPLLKNLTRMFLGVYIANNLLNHSLFINQKRRTKNTIIGTSHKLLLSSNSIGKCNFMGLITQ